MFIDIESLIDMFGEKENCIRCGKPIDCRDWVCLACKAEIAKVDISERKFELLDDAQRQKIVDMSAQEFLEYCGGDSFLMTAEEQEVYNIKSRNDNKLKNTEYECEKCNNNLHIHTIQWNNEYKRFFDVSEPCECVKVRKSIELMRESGLSSIIKEYTFDKFTTKEKWQKEIKDKAQQFIENIDDGQWFMVSGQTGSGKSMICTAIVRELLYKVIPCRYMVWDSEITELNAIVNEPKFAIRMNELRTVKVLYIDDFFKPLSDNIKPTQGELKRAKDIIDYRYRNRLTTIISSELSIEEIMSIDEAIGGRIYERSKLYNIHISGTDKNYRLR